MRRLATITLALTTTLASHGVAQATLRGSAPLVDTLIVLSNEWMAALQRHDAPALERLMAPEFTLVHPSQDSVTRRREWLAAGARLQAWSFRYTHLSVVRHGPDLAVVSGIFITDAELDGRQFVPKTSVIDVWERRDGRWQVVTRYATRPQELSPIAAMSSDEMKARKFANVYEAITRLHADWLATTAEGKVGVFYSGERADVGIEHLRSVAPESVTLVRHLTGTESAAAYGPEWKWGAIVLTRR